MKGAESLRFMRRRGYAPSMVFLDTEDNRLRPWADWERINPNHAHLTPERNDVPARADLRCVVGLRVLVQGDDADAVHAWRDACIAAKASRVVASVTRCIESDPLYARYETLEMTDTAGLLAPRHEEAIHHG